MHEAGRLLNTPSERKGREDTNDGGRGGLRPWDGMVVRGYVMTGPWHRTSTLKHNSAVELGLTPTFNTWAQITLLHMYLLTVRMRCFPPDHAPAWHQHMIDHFSYAAEDRMVVLHNISSRMMRNRYLKDLFVQWRGLTAAYDEGLVKGDAVLAAAVWRNIFKGDEDVDLRQLGQVVSYMRSVLSKLDAMGDEAIASGDVVFGDPGSEAALVRVRSKMMDQPFTEGKGEPVTKEMPGQVAGGLGLTS